MTRDELKTLLKSAGSIHKRIQLALEEKQIALDAAMNCTPSFTEGMATGNGKKIETNVIKAQSIQEQIDIETAKFYESLRRIHRLILLVDNVNIQNVLYERYCLCHTWEQITVSQHYSWRQVHRYHAKGLKIILEKMA